MRTGKRQSASLLNAKASDYVLNTYSMRRSSLRTRRRFTAEELHARLIVTIGIILAIVFALSVSAMLYALLFITQPMKQAPNDAAFIDLVSTLTVFLTGTLAGIVSANGLKSKPIKKEDEPPSVS
jgi:polyferredoxin